VGYALRKVERNEVFGPLEGPGAFEKSPLSRMGMSLAQVRCEAFFYDALLEGVGGDPRDRRKRERKLLEKVVKTGCFTYFEYLMAGCLLHKAR
jgi:hypothetical protein